MKKILVLVLALAVLCLSSCQGYVGNFLEAYCDFEELNVNKITVRLHNRETVCCIRSISYELEYFEGDEIDIYIPQEVILTENGKTYTVRELGGQGISDGISISINIQGRELTREEVLGMKVNIHLGNVKLNQFHNPRVWINQHEHLDKDGKVFFVE